MATQKSTYNILFKNLCNLSNLENDFLDFILSRRKVDNDDDRLRGMKIEKKGKCESELIN